MHNSRLAFDPSFHDIDHSNFWECDWIDFNEGAVNVIPANASLLRGKVMDL